MVSTLHLVYPHAQRISCPDAIGRNLGRRLADHYQVEYHDWESPDVVRPKSGDILVGHANPSPFTCFRLSLCQPGWRRVILITPYTHGDTRYNAFIESFIRRCDLYLAITGSYWYDSVPHSLYAHWHPKMVHLNLAVDRKDFPVIKREFNPIGRRRFVFIGKSSSIKNVHYLSQVAKEAREITFGWIGAGRRIPGLLQLGFYDFATSEGRALLNIYDFMLTVSKADSNPATILEAMSWGLIPVCTPQSGYVGYPGIVNIPLDDPVGVARLLRQLQELPGSELHELQAANWRLLDEVFNWDRFAQQVMDAIESEASPAVEPITLWKRQYITWRAFQAPYATWRRPRHLGRVAMRFLKKRMTVL